jgi:hypothetical protein
LFGFCFPFIATFFGKGVYYARDASYSASSTYSTIDKDGNQYMMACRVIVGEYCQGHKDALTPDVRDAKTHQLYDSTVNDGYNPSIYVTYNDAQAYPEVRNTGEGITTQRFTWHLVKFFSSAHFTRPFFLAQYLVTFRTAQ